MRNIIIRFNNLNRLIQMKCTRRGKESLANLLILISKLSSTEKNHTFLNKELAWTCIQQRVDSYCQDALMSSGGRSHLLKVHLRLLQKAATNQDLVDLQNRANCLQSLVQRASRRFIISEVGKRIPNERIIVGALREAFVELMYELDSFVGDRNCQALTDESKYERTAKFQLNRINSILLISGMKLNFLSEKNFKESMKTYPLRKSLHRNIDISIKASLLYTLCLN